MLNKRDQVRYLNRELSSVRKFLTSGTLTQPGKTQIHDIRVNIKKIIALIELNKIRGYEPGNLPMLGMRMLFKTTGTIRSSQIALSRLEKSGIKEKKISDPHKEIIRLTTKKLIAEVPAYLKMLNAFRIEMISKKLNNITNEQVFLYHELKSEYLKKIFKIPLDPDTIHEGRKQIKHILYIHELIKPSTRKKIPFNFDNLNELQDLIGKWHDSAVYLDFLRGIRMEKKQKWVKELLQKKKDQFENINIFRLDKNKEIFVSSSQQPRAR
jgi:CHAD domain-containing protein